MLVTLREILKIAEAKKIAVGSFNTPNLESAMAVISAAEKLNQPVIIMHAEIHESMMPIDIIGPIMVGLADRASVPVCVHLDHGADLAYLKHALELGFTSVMYDGSALEYDENYANTCIAVMLAKRFGASVEAEIGVILRKETAAGAAEEPEPDEPEDPSATYTDPDLAKKFAEDTGIDALACAFGTAHGIYSKTPKLDFDRLAKIHSMVKVPIVMHGGSGVSNEDYRKAIECGVRKINYYTYMAKAGGEAVIRSTDSVKYFHDLYSTGISYKDNEADDKLGKNAETIKFYHDVVNIGVKAMMEDVGHAIDVFALGAGKK